MKNKKQASIIFILLTSVVLVLGSCRKEKVSPEQANSFIKYYGKGGTQKAGNVALTPDGGYILVGTSDSYGDGKQILVIKTDKFGNEQWNKVLGGAGDDEGNWIAVTTDGGYIIAGSKAESSGVNTNAWIIKLNNDGSQMQEFTFGNVGYQEKGNKIIPTKDQGYIVIGSTTNTTKALSAVYLVKVNAAFNREWEAIYGVNNTTGIPSYTATNVGSAIQQLDDSVYLTSASTVINSPFPVSNMLVTTGKLKIDGTYDATSNYDKNGAIVQTDIANAKDILAIPGSGFVLGNTISTTNANIYLLKLNISLSSVSKNFYKEIGTSGNDIANGFSRNSDGGFIITGSTTNTSDGNTDVIVIRIDAEGNTIWTKQFGGNGDDYGISAVQTVNGGFIISATMKFGGNATGANNLISLIHLNANGELK